MRVNKTIKSKLYRYFKYRLNLIKSTKGFLRGDCPHCGGKFTFGVNVDSMKIKCFKDCGITTSPLKLILEIERFQTMSELFLFLNTQQEFEGYDSLMREVEKPLERKSVELPESFTLLNLGDGIIAKAARHSMRKRHFDITELSIKGVGYCYDGPYMGYIIFPFYEMGQLVFFQGRKFASTGPKMQNPKSEDFGIGKSSLIYNKDALFIYNTIYVLESITNSNTLGPRAIAILGKTISPEQLSLLIKSPAKNFVILLDPDALEDSITLCLQLVQYKRVKLVYWEPWPNGMGPDVNDMGKRKTLKLIKSFDYSTYGDLLKLRNKIKYEKGLNTYNRREVNPINVKSYLR